MKRFPGRADIDVEVRGPALQKHHPAAPIVLCLLAAALFLAGASAARSFGTPRNLAAPRITGEAKVGSRLSASHGHWAGHPRSFRYAWHRCNKGRKCVKVGRASKRTYVVNSTDVGHRLRVVVIAANGDGMAQARSVWSKPVKKRDHGRPPPPPPPPGAPAPMPASAAANPRTPPQRRKRRATPTTRATARTGARTGAPGSRTTSPRSQLRTEGRSSSAGTTTPS